MFISPSKMAHRLATVDIEVQPLPHLPSIRLGESSSSTSQQDDIAYATHTIFDKLIRDFNDEMESSKAIYVALQWPEEGRIAGKGKNRSLVIQVRRPPTDLVGGQYKENRVPNLIHQRHDPMSEFLYVPLQFLPRYSEVPLRATIRLHQPVELSQIILQPLSEDCSVSKIGDLDLRTLTSREPTAVSEELYEANGHNANGHINGDTEPDHGLLRILREGHNVLVTTTFDNHPLPFRILMLEPVAQGYITWKTRVVLSTTPYDPDSEDEDDAEGSIYGQSSHGKTHLSMVDFDPDTFLSSSLALALQYPSVNGGDMDGDMEQSVSSTSGSITPRPPGATFRSPSPPARPLDMEDMNEEDVEAVGTRFGAIVAQGSGGLQDEVCWVSVGGLGRAGIFEGDWVGLVQDMRSGLTARFCFDLSPLLPHLVDWLVCSHGSAWMRTLMSCQSCETILP